MALEKPKLPSAITGDGRSLIQSISNFFDKVITSLNGLSPITAGFQVSDLSASEVWEEVDGVVIPCLTIEWDSSTVLEYAYAELYRATSGGQYEYIDIATTSYTFGDVEVGGSYTIKVVAVNKLGVKSYFSAAPTISHTISGERNTISVPDNVYLTFNRQGAFLEWDAVTDADLDCYVIRSSTDLTNPSDILATNITATYYYIVPTLRHGAVYLYARNNLGHYSDPVEVTYDKPYPYAPMNLVAIKSLDDIYIQFSNIPDDCTGAHVYINSTPVFVTDNTYLHSESVRVATVQVAYVDVFGEGNLSKQLIVEPPDVTGLTLTPQPADRSLLRLSWEPVTDPYFAYYDIRLGDNWSTAQVLATQLKAFSYDYKASSEGYKSFLVRCYNTLGYDSANSAAATVQLVLRPNPPTNPAAVQNSQDRSIVLLSWVGLVDLDIEGYEVRVATGQQTWDNATAVTFTKEINAQHKLTVSGTYTYMIKAKTVAGYYSIPASVPITVSIEALDVTGFTGVQSVSDHSQVRLLWDQPSSLDTAYFEIRRGSTWDSGELVATRISGTFFDVTVLEETPQTFWIKAVTVGGSYSQNAASIAGVYTLNPSTPQNLLVTQDPSDKSKLIITWDAIPEADILEYQVAIGGTWELATVIAITKELKTEYSPATSGGYTVLVRARSNANFYSDEARYTIYATLEPANVTGFRATQNGANVLLTWAKVTGEADVVGYEVREGTGFENGTLIATNIPGLNHQTPVDTEREYHYHIKAINRSGRYSQVAASSSVEVDNLPPRNVILQYDELSLQSGTHSHTEFAASSVNFSNLGGRFSDYPTTRFNAAGGASVLRLAKSDGVNYYTSGEYTVVRKDVGGVITANIGSQFITSILTAAGVNARLQYRISQNGSTFTDWQDFVPVTATFRYIDFKAILTTSDETKTPEITVFEELIDVPDVDRAGTSVVAVGGTTINFGYTYYATPAVVPTAVGAGLVADLISVGYSSFNVKVLDSAGTDVGGTVVWIARGY